MGKKVALTRSRLRMARSARTASEEKQSSIVMAMTGCFLDPFETTDVPGTRTVGGYARAGRGVGDGTTAGRGAGDGPGDDSGAAEGALDAPGAGIETGGGTGIAPAKRGALEAGTGSGAAVRAEGAGQGGGSAAHAARARARAPIPAARAASRDAARGLSRSAEMETGKLRHSRESGRMNPPAQGPFWARLRGPPTAPASGRGMTPVPASSKQRLAQTAGLQRR